MIRRHLRQVGVALSYFNEESGRYKEAVQIATEVYDLAPKDGPTMGRLFRALKANESYQAMFDLAKDIHKQEGIEHDGMSRFEEHMLSYSCFDFGPMSKISEAKDWFFPLVEHITTICWERRKYMPLLNLAVLKQQYFDPLPNPERDFKQILKAPPPEDDSQASNYKYCRRLAARHLSHIYLQRAVVAQASGQDFTQWTSELQNLPTHNGRGLKGQALAGDTIPSMIYGHWLRKYEKADPPVWIPYFRFSINSALDLLEDDVPSNDQSAFSNLGAFLLMAGDVFNARAAHAVTMKPLEIVSADPSRVAELRKADNLRVIWNCDGECRTRKTRYKELHFCEDCWDTCFCENCIVLVREGRLPFRTCSPKHAFVQMYPVAEEMRGVAATFTEPDFKLETRKAWLDGLRKAWKADESK